MRAWVSTSVDWIKSQLSKTTLSSTTAKLSSLGGKIVSKLAVPFKALASGIGSLITTFLSGNWVGVIFHPITLTVLAFSVGMGWAYNKGLQHDRRADAAAIIELNKRVERWQEAYQEADKKAEAKLQSALESWRKASGTRVVSAAQCKIDAQTATTIADIAGDLP